MVENKVFNFSAHRDPMAALAREKKITRPSHLRLIHFPREGIRVPVLAEPDILTARRRGWTLAMQWGFSPTDATLISSVISELARNILLHAVRGEVTLRIVEEDLKRAIVIMAYDEGPGIPDIEQALNNKGFSPTGRSGLGLSGIKQAMDEFNIISEIGHGITVTVKKWKR